MLQPVICSRKILHNETKVTNPKAMHDVKVQCKTIQSPFSWENSNLVPRAFLRRGEDEREKPWEKSSEAPKQHFEVLVHLHFSWRSALWLKQCILAKSGEFASSSYLIHFSINPLCCCSSLRSLRSNHCHIVTITECSLPLFASIFFSFCYSFFGPLKAINLNGFSL